MQYSRSGGYLSSTNPTGINNVYSTSDNKQQPRVQNSFTSKLSQLKSQNLPKSFSVQSYYDYMSHNQHLQPQQTGQNLYVNSSVSSAGTSCNNHVTIQNQIMGSQGYSTQQEQKKVMNNIRIFSVIAPPPATHNSKIAPRPPPPQVYISLFITKNFPLYLVNRGLLY